jgi:hypothetical protein
MVFKVSPRITECQPSILNYFHFLFSRDTAYIIIEMKPEKKYSHHRSPEQRQISISLPDHIVIKATEIARRQHRSRSALVCLLLEREIKEFEKQHQSPIALVAEKEPNEYGKPHE